MKPVSSLPYSQVPATRPALQYVSTLSHKRFSKKKIIENKMCVSIFSTFFSEKFLIRRRREQGMIIHVYRSSHKVPAILVRF
jgi:hypothetical protein